MQIYKDLDYPVSLSNPVAAIGSFDGVHLGHQRILQYLCSLARRLHGESVVVTFDPHPQRVLYPESDFFMINPLEENLRLIEAQGVDATVIIPFTRQLSQLTYTEFIDEIIIRKIHVKALVMGPNHALGHNRAGNLKSIEALCRQRDLQVEKIPELMVRESVVRSAKIRELIQNKKWSEADALLGYSYSENKK